MKVSIKILLCSSTPHRFQIIQPSQLKMSLVGNITNLGNETITQVCAVLVNVYNDVYLQLLSYTSLSW